MLDGLSESHSSPFWPIQVLPPPSALYSTDYFLIHSVTDCASVAVSLLWMFYAVTWKRANHSRNLEVKVVFIFVSMLKEFFLLQARKVISFYLINKSYCSSHNNCNLSLLVIESYFELIGKTTVLRLWSMKPVPLRISSALRTQQLWLALGQQSDWEIPSLRALPVIEL